VIRDETVHLSVLEAVRRSIEEDHPWSVVGATWSPLLGPAGNTEFFFHLKTESLAGGGAGPDLAALVSRAHAVLHGSAESEETG
jgi:hypothetical protein